MVKDEPRARIAYGKGATERTVTMGTTGPCVKSTRSDAYVKSAPKRGT